MHFISEEKLHVLLTRLTNEYKTYIPRKRNNKLYEDEFKENGNSYTIDEVRACEPLKVFFFRAREKVADDFTAGVPPPPAKPFCIVGAKSCDLQSLKVQDFVFLTDEYPDPFYQKMRGNNLIISADCSQALDTCFCLALGVKPFPEENFDINLSKTDNGYLLETGSPKGEKIVKDNERLLGPPAPEAIRQRRDTRERVQRQVENNIKKHGIPPASSLPGRIKKNYTYAFWNQDAKACVECGACNTICPTCHCFLLYDQGDRGKMSRFRIWDSCLVKDFAGVAGGANPRPELWMRLRNRFEKKFDFFPGLLGLNACTGCGRCISACPAKIDIRKVLGRLAADAQ